jgi:putative ABC transport system permease protein
MVVGLAVVGAIMILLMALVMRGRLREIGILKAIGAKSRQIVSQFALETAGIALVAVLIAVPSVLVTNTFLPDLLRPSSEAAEANENGPQSRVRAVAGSVRCALAAPMSPTPCARRTSRPRSTRSTPV